MVNKNEKLHGEPETANVLALLVPEAVAAIEPEQNQEEPAEQPVSNPITEALPEPSREVSVSGNAEVPTATGAAKPTLVKRTSSVLTPRGHPKPLDSKGFPDQPCPDASPLPASMANVEHMLNAYGLIARYNTIKKKQELLVPGLSCIQDNLDNTAWTCATNLAAINKIYNGNTERYIQAICNVNHYNPVAEWIESKPWDGEDRLFPLINTLKTSNEYDPQLKRTLIHKWTRSAVAAIFWPSGFSARGVLVLQGPQASGKTSWVRATISDPALREAVMKLDHHLDGSNKDTVITAVTHWIVEIGELDSSFRKDIARLKGLITADTDKVRLPYHRRDSEFPRRTVFCATVNSQHFLVDDTGNSRWWTIPVTSINYEHGIDMQQFWAQIRAEFLAGDVQWWLTPEEEILLNTYNRNHRAVNTIRERLEAQLDLDAPKSERKFHTATHALQAIGIASPSNRQAQNAGEVLREHCGDPIKRRGISGWLIALRDVTRYERLLGIGHSDAQEEPSMDFGDLG